LDQARIAMPQISYETVDVFAERRFGGNPLAVVADARGLSTEAMQAIAREFNYSESTFVLPPSDPRNTAHVRIFTPANEIPFAGHPNVGTAFVLARMGTLFERPVSEVMRFEEGAGLVEIEVLRRNGKIAGASIQAPQQLELAEAIAPSTIAACASIDARDVLGEKHQPVFASVGLPFAIAELRSLESLGLATPNAAAFRDARQHHPGPIDRFSLFLYVRNGAGKVRARMFAPLSKVLEDPATGSASAALGGLLSSLEPGVEPFQLTIEQGVEMGRPSVIHVRVAARDGRQSIVVTGECVPVMRGAIALPEAG
jgi:trans-2,3-dihydro-3-hydroxyanthranilate isomerase